MRGSSRDPDPELLRSMEQAGILLLPLFFVVTVLSLDIGTLHGDALVLLVLLVAVACVAKVVPAYLVSIWPPQATHRDCTAAGFHEIRGG